MTDTKYRVAAIKFEESSKFYYYLCEDLNIKSDDFVVVEGQEKVVKIYKVGYILESKLPVPFEKMKKVIKKVNFFGKKQDNIVESIVEDVKKENTPNIENEEKNVNLKTIKLSANVSKEFAYVDYHTDTLMKARNYCDSTEYSFISKISIKNKTDNTYEDTRLRFTFAHSIFNMDDLYIGTVEENEDVSLKIPFIKVDKVKLEEIKEKEASSLKIELLDSSNKIICSEEYPFVILPLSQTSNLIFSDARLYAKFITPLASKVKQITLNANKENGGSIIAYQNDDKNAMLKEIESIYVALHKYGIAYQNPPAGGLTSQRIRMPEEVLTDKKGTCLDLSILFCACLEEVGYHSILVCIEGHAYAGAFLDSEITFAYGRETNKTTLYNYATAGINKVVLVECTTYCLNSKCNFKDAVKIGVYKINNEKDIFECAIDVNLAHKGVFSPLPIHGQNEDLSQVIKPVEQRRESLTPIIESKVINVLKKDKDRFTFWERKLLDLSEKNTLVNFKISQNNCLKMCTDDPITVVLKRNEGMKFKVGEFSNYSFLDVFYSDYKPKQHFGEKKSYDLMVAIGFDKALKSLIKKSNEAMEESGFSTLYLCFGVIKYKRKKGENGTAPFMLLPVKVTKDKTSPDYSLEYDYDDIMINQTFFEYYRQEHGVDFSNLYYATSDDSYLDIVHTFKQVNADGLQLVEDVCFIANLTFGKYILWQDIKQRKEELKKNKVIQSIVANKNVLGEIMTDYDKPIDELEQYNDFAAPLYYDSTQLKAILKCGEGKSFILDGPPGTGKSQTIVNMIVNAFYQGKTVLFVAEKKAALDVVSDRLKKLGDPTNGNNLGRFCLELHSNKTSKQEFFSKIKESMDLGVSKKIPNHGEVCRDLKNKRDNLLKIINKMHVKKYKYSFYESIVRYEELKSYTQVDLSSEHLKNLTEDKFNLIKSNIDKYISYANNIKNYDDNPMKFFFVDNIRLNEKDTYLKEFIKMKTLLKEFFELYKNLTENFEIKFQNTQRMIFTVMKLLDICFNRKIYIDSLSEFISNQSDDKQLLVLGTAEKLYNLLNEIKDIFELDKINNIDYGLAIKELTNPKNFINKFINTIKWKSTLKKVLKPTHEFNKNELIKYYNYIGEYNSLLRNLKNSSNIVKDMINVDVIKEINNIKDIKLKYITTRQFITYLKYVSISKDFMKVSTFFINLYTTKNPSIKMLLSLCNVKYNEMLEFEKIFNSKYLVNYKVLAKKPNNLTHYLSVLEYLNENTFNEFIDVSAINKISLELKKLGISQLIDALVEGKFKYQDFSEVHELSCITGIIKLYFADDDINFFNPSGFVDEIKKYKDLINEYNKVTIAHVSAKLTEKLNHNSIEYANSSPIGRLKKSIANNGRGVTIRDTLINFDGIIKSYFPCFLMSPLSAAQFLSVDENGGRSASKFDIVIFDEASQIPTYDSIGAIARGKSLIVAGDPEQMPPSSYFNGGLQLEEEDIVFEDAPSLLDECISIDLPRIRLAYHYRSKHESLISFSNQNFYNGDLYTFPSTIATNSLVEFNYVETKEAKQNSAITKEEIDAICNKVKEVYNNPENKKKSLGIIVFNTNQKDKVTDEIAKLRDKDKALNEIIEAAEEKTQEPLFVKNLENVQGDERDIIILSIGFAKNSNGTPKIGGPVDHDNGERRLNVAASRSKEKMIVISTIRYSDFQADELLPNKARLFFKRFIKFAEESTFGSTKTNKVEEHSIVNFIKKDLENLGYDVVSNVGNSEFKVDLAILSKDKKKYSLGILIDSKGISKNISLRDKLYVQESVLNSLKWKIINIYTVEYYKNKKATIDKIIEAMKVPYVKEEYKTTVKIQKEKVPIFKYDTLKYNKFKYNSQITYDNEDGYSYHIKKFLESLINTESPISFETIKTRVREYSNIQSMSSKAKMKLEAELRAFGNVTKDQTQLVYWADNKREVSHFRPNTDRDLYDIPKEEIVCVMKQILKVQLEMSEEDLFRCTLETLEYGQAVLNKKNLDRLTYVYTWAKANNKLH